MPYEHTQRSRLPVLYFIGYVILTGLTVALSGEVAEVLLTMGISGVVVLFVVVWFSVLQIRVDEETVRVSFGGGWPRRTMQVEDLVGFSPVRNKWFYGWGIRRIPSGWMYNVWGLDAVELELASGKRFTIGTDEPLELIHALERRTRLERSR